MYLAKRKESISYHYERNPADPRVVQQLTLKFDDWGNVIENRDGDRVGKDIHLLFRLQGAAQNELINPGDDFPCLIEKDRILVTEESYNKNQHQ